MRSGLANLFIIFSSLVLKAVLGEEIQSVPLQFISFSAVPDIPFAERLLTYRAGSNIIAGEDASKIGSLNTTGDTCPVESECSFMSNCPTLRRVQPSTRCEVSLNPSGGVASSMRLPGGTCCRKSRQSSPSSTNSFINSRPSPVLSAAISAAAFGTSGGAELADQDLTVRTRKSGHLVNFVAPPNGQIQYNNGGKSPLVLLAPSQNSKMSFLPGKAPVNLVKQTRGSTLSGPTTPQNGPSSVNGEKASQFFYNLPNPLPTTTTTTRPTGDVDINHALAQIVPSGKEVFLQNQPPPQQQPQQLQQPVPPRFDQPQQYNIQQQLPEVPTFQPPPVPQNFQQLQSPAPTLASSLPPPFQQPQNFVNPYPQYPQGPFQGPQQLQQPQQPQQPEGPQYLTAPNGVGPPVLQQQQFISPPPVQQQINIVYQQPPQAPPQQQFMPASPTYSQQSQNFSPQMPIPVMPSYGQNPNQNQMPNANFVPPQQQQQPPPQTQPQVPLTQQQQTQALFMPQLLPLNQIPITQNLSNFQQFPLPSRTSVIPQEQPPAPVFSSFSAIPTSPSTTFCGVRDPTLSRRAGRILGGRPSDFGAWPWMAVITSSKRLRCGATILNDQFLITAAHCIYKNFQYGYYQDLVIRIGIFNMDEDEVGPYAPQEVRIYRVYVHPYFNATQSSYDIALIQVATPIIFRPHIKPVCLPSSEHLGEMGTVLGWGKRKESDDRSNLPMVLQEVNLPVLYPWQCILELRGNNINEDIGPQFVCAGGRANQDACKGDSGGPLLASSNGQYWEMIGIVSKGYGCGKENVPGIYTNIFYLKDWIESTVSANWNIFPGQFGSRERSSYYR